MTPPPPRSTLFPYTTLFRSAIQRKAAGAVLRCRRQPASLYRVTDQHIEDGVERRGIFRIDEQGRCVPVRSEEHTSELQSRRDLVCRLLLEKKKKKNSRTQLK